MRIRAMGIKRGVNQRVAASVAASVILALAATAVPAVAQSFAPTGVLRAVFLGSNPVQGRTDSRTGAVSGPANDLIRELAARLGVPFSLEGVADVRTVI